MAGNARVGVEERLAKASAPHRGGINARVERIVGHLSHMYVFHVV